MLLRGRHTLLEAGNAALDYRRRPILANAAE
jgi:hypothetical protein